MDQPFGDNAKFQTHVYSHREKGEGWVNLAKSEQGFRWVELPPEPSNGRMEVMMLDFLWHLGHPVVSKGGAEAAYKSVWDKVKPIIDRFNVQPLQV